MDGKLQPLAVIFLHSYKYHSITILHDILHLQDPDMSTDQRYAIVALH